MTHDYIHDYIRPPDESEKKVDVDENLAWPATKRHAN